MASIEASTGASKPSGGSDRKQKKVIFYTSSEYGQANVILAVAYEMLLLQQYSIHIASFAPLKDRIQTLNESVTNNRVPAVFHTVFGLSALQSVISKEEFIGPYPPGIKGALQTYRVTLPAIATVWDGPTYMKTYESCLEIFRSVEPDVIVLDPQFSHGLDACKALSRSFVMLSPNTFQEMCRGHQPKFTALCRYPALSSGFPYPVPWYLIPANVYLNLMLFWTLTSSTTVKEFMDYRKEHGLSGVDESYDFGKQKNHFLVPSTPETDFPSIVPPHVTGCGPILLPTHPVSKDDPALQSWLEQAPTILVNLGTHAQMDDTMARELVSGLKKVLDTKPEVQILWKLKTSRGLGLRSRTGPANGFQPIKDGFLDPISAEISAGRVKIMEWMSVSPLAVLQTGHVVCSVHHGGSNSYHEALSGGVPQVVLPCWLDTFEFARRVEWLGIGVYGSRSSAPSVESREFSRAVLKLLSDGTESARIKKRAKELADISSRVGGRKKACEKIIEILECS